VAKDSYLKFHIQKEAPSSVFSRRHLINSLFLNQSASLQKSRTQRNLYLVRELTDRTRALLKADSERRPASGMRLVADNPKLMRPGMRRYLERHGCVYRGTDRHGIDRWFAPFD
jgi:hypothetical protein